jgi:hypothetical protein
VKTTKNIAIIALFLMGLASFRSAEAAKNSTLDAGVPLILDSSEILSRLEQRGLKIDNRLQAIEKKLVRPTPFWTGATVVGLVAAISAALSGFLVARFTTKWNANAAQAARLEAHLFESLGWFEKGTQKRSIGLSIIEANWDSSPQLHETWVSVLLNQALYLLGEKPEAKTATHERENRRRILALLKKVRLSKGQREAIYHALKKRSDFKNMAEDEEQGWKDLASIPSDSESFDTLDKN